MGARTRCPGHLEYGSRKPAPTVWFDSRSERASAPERDLLAALLPPPACDPMIIPIEHARRMMVVRSAIDSYVMDLIRVARGAPAPGLPRGRQLYGARIEERAQRRGRHRHFEIDWNDEFIADLTSLCTPGDLYAARLRVGQRLRHALMRTDWQRHEQAVLERLRRGEQVSVTVCSQAADLYLLPWELLALGESGQHLGEFSSALISYAWPGAKPTPRAPAPARERVVMAWSAAGGPVPAHSHAAALERTCPTDVFRAERDIVAHATPRSLRDALTGAPVTHLHLLCHGHSDERTIAVHLADDRGRPMAVTPDRLRQLLPQSGHLHCVVLCVCASGDGDAASAHLGSLAQALHRAGIGAVIGARYPLSKLGSSQFAEGFYERLFQGGESVAQAFSGTRQELSLCPEHSDWASLQLYAHTVPAAATSAPATSAPAQALSIALYNQATGLEWTVEAERRATLGQLVGIFRRAVRARPWPDPDVPRPTVHHVVHFFRTGDDADALPLRCPLGDLIDAGSDCLTLNVGWSMTFRNPEGTHSAR